MYYHPDAKSLTSKVQAPFVLAAIRALRTSIFKKSPEVQRALAIAEKVEQTYDLTRTDLFVPAGETLQIILEPFAQTILTGTLRRVGYEIFPQFVAIQGVPASNVKAAMQLKDGVDLIRLICTSYNVCVVGSDSGALIPEMMGSSVSVTDTTFLPCHMQMGVFLGAGKLTGLIRESSCIERRCRAKGDSVCSYDFAL